MTGHQFLKQKKPDKLDSKIVNTVGKMKKLKLMHKNKVKIRKKQNILKKNQPLLFKETANNKTLNKWD